MNENKICVLKRGQPTQAGGGQDNGWDITYENSSTTINVDLYKQYIDMIDRKMQIAFLKGNLSTEVAESGGNRAAADTHFAVEKQNTINDAKWLDELLRTQVLRHWARQFNAINPPQLPNIKFDINSGIDNDDKYESMTKLIELARTSRELGFEIDNFEELAGSSGIKLKKIKVTNEEPKTSTTEDSNLGQDGQSDVKE